MKESVDNKNIVKKKQRELEEELKLLDMNKKELEKEGQGVKPHKKIEELQKKILKVEKNENYNKTEANMIINKYKIQIEKYKLVLKKFEEISKKKVNYYQK